MDNEKFKDLCRLFRHHHKLTYRSALNALGLSVSKTGRWERYEKRGAQSQMIRETITGLIVAYNKKVGVDQMKKPPTPERRKAALALATGVPANSIILYGERDSIMC